MEEEEVKVVVEEEEVKVVVEEEEEEEEEKAICLKCASALYLSQLIQRSLEQLKHRPRRQL